MHASRQVVAESVAGYALMQREAYGGDTPADSAMEEDGEEAAANVELFLQRAQQALQDHRHRLALVSAPRPLALAPHHLQVQLGRPLAFFM